MEGNKMRALAVAVATILMLPGCTSGITAIMNRDLLEKEVGGYEFAAMPAVRRVAVAIEGVEDADGHSEVSGPFCAEAQPDVAASITANTEADLDAAFNAQETIGIDMKDKYERALTTLYQRSDLSEMVRQLGWHICLAYLNEAIDSSQYYKLLELTVTSAFGALTGRGMTGQSGISGG